MALSINDQDIQCEVWRNHLNKVQWKPVQPGFGLVQSWNVFNVTRGSHGLIHPAIPQGLPVWDNQPSTSSCSHHLCLLRMILSETAGVQPWISRERNEKRMEKDYSAAMEFDRWMDPTGNCLLNALWYRVGRVGHNTWQPVSAWSKDQNISPKGRGKEIRGYLKVDILHSDQKLILPVGGYQNHQKYKDYAVSKCWYNPDNPHIAWLASQKPSQNFAKHLDESTTQANSAIVTRTDWRDLSWWAKASQKTRIQQSMTESRLCLWSGTPNSLTSPAGDGSQFEKWDSIWFGKPRYFTSKWPLHSDLERSQKPSSIHFFGRGWCIRDDTLSCSLDLFRASWPSHLPNRFNKDFTKFGVSLHKIMVPKKKIHGVWCLFLVWDFQDKKNELVPMFSRTQDSLKVFCFQSPENSCEYSLILTIWSEKSNSQVCFFHLWSSSMKIVQVEKFQVACQGAKKGGRLRENMVSA